MIRDANAHLRRSPATWHFVLLLNIALLSFCETTRQVEALIAIGVVDLALLVPRRLPRSRTLAAALRLGIFTPIVMHVGIPAESFPQWYMKPSYTTLIGCLLAAESAIRAWEPLGGFLSGDPRGVLLFVSALIMAAAANTPEKFPINWLAPIYAAIAITALRNYDGRRPRLSWLAAVRLMALCCVMLAGYQLVAGINRYDEELNSLVERLLYQQRRRPYEIGMSPSPRLGWVFNPLQQADRVMLVEGSLSERYLAAAQFDQYSAMQWTPSLNSRQYVSADPRDLRRNESGTRLTFTRVGSDLNLLPMPASSVSIETTSGVEQDDFGALRHTEPNLTGASSQYVSVVSLNDSAQGPLLKPLTDVQRKLALQLPENFDPAAIQLARSTAQGRRDAEAVTRLTSYIRSTHEYSLRYHPSGPEPISQFILGNDAAHCIYFASALVMMCRANGIPARLVTGYYGWEYFAENTIVVRSRDAHAWCEAWIDGAGWLSFDATPSGGRPDALNQPTSWLQRTWERISDWPGEFRDWISQFSETAIVSLFIGLAALLFLLFLYRFLILKRRSTRQSWASRYANNDRQLSRAARRFNRWLARRGLNCQDWQSWRQCLGDDSEAEGFLRAYENARYGQTGESETRAALAELRRLELQRVSDRRQSAINASTEV